VIVRSEMPASVREVRVSSGERVRAGAELVVLESMKMEIPVAAEAAGTVGRVLVRRGDVVGEGDPLLEVSPDQ
jgi:acetyl-CoA carboxylase biotin carboxyl carrier protein